MRNSTRVTVDGKSFMLRGEATVEHIQRVAGYVDGKITEIRRETIAIRLDPTMAYVLTALNIADDFMNCENKISDLEIELTDLEKENERLRKTIRELKAEREPKSLQDIPYNGVDLDIVSEVEFLDEPESSTLPEDEYSEIEEFVAEDTEPAHKEKDDMDGYIEELEELSQIEIPRTIREKTYLDRGQSRQSRASQYTSQRRSVRRNNRREDT